MANEEQPKSPENPLAEVAKSIGTTLGTAQNRASEMFRDVMPTAISEKLGMGSEPSKKAKKGVSAKKASGAAKKKTSARKSAAKKKSKPAKPAAKKKASKSPKKKSARKSR